MIFLFSSIFGIDTDTLVTLASLESLSLDRSCRGHIIARCTPTRTRHTRRHISHREAAVRARKACSARAAHITSPNYNILSLTPPPRHRLSSGAAPPLAQHPGRCPLACAETTRERERSQNAANGRDRKGRGDPIFLARRRTNAPVREGDAINDKGGGHEGDVGVLPILPLALLAGLPR